MKHFVVGLLLVVTAMPWLSCEAGEDSTARERKKLTPATEQRHKIRVSHQSQVAMAHPKRAGFCRDFYCVHAGRSPWWPGAPGD